MHSNSGRRKWTAPAAALFFAAASMFAPPLPGAETDADPAAVRTGIFPFFKFAQRHDIWEYIPLDQGGREIQLQVIGSERDEDVVRAVRRPGFFAPWGVPLVWDSLETTEP